MPAERSTLQAIPGWLLTLPGHVLYYAEIITILVVGNLKIRKLRMNMKKLLSQPGSKSNNNKKSFIFSFLLYLLISHFID
jgi:hypothetical protein